jgi:transposase-like protein
MGQVRHGSATTTHAVRAAIQRSQASLATLSRELGINPKTVAKWRKRTTVEDLKTGPKAPAAKPDTAPAPVEAATTASEPKPRGRPRKAAADPVEAQTAAVAAPASMEAPSPVAAPDESQAAPVADKPKRGRPAKLKPTYAPDEAPGEAPGVKDDDFFDATAE